GANTQDGSLYVIPPTEQNTFLNYFDSDDPCVMDRLRIMRNVNKIGLVRIPSSGRTIFYRSDSKTAYATFGVSGRVFDADGEPLPGAAVKVQDPRTGISGPVTTNECGTFHLLGVVDRIYGSTGPVIIEISHSDIGA